MTDHLSPRVRKAIALARREHYLDLRRARRMAMLDGDHAEAHRIAIELYGEDAADLMRAEGIAARERLERKALAARERRERERSCLHEALVLAGWTPGTCETAAQRAEAARWMVEHHPDLVEEIQAKPIATSPELQRNPGESDFRYERRLELELVKVRGEKAVIEKRLGWRS